jgi:hypothetical protein
MQSQKSEIATLPLVARNDNVTAFNAFVLVTYAYSFGLSSGFGLHTGQ